MRGRLSLGGADEFHCPSQSEIEDSRTSLRGVVADSVRLLMMEHSTRIIVQAKTRRELGGPFWNDYRRSVRILDHGVMVMDGW
jgi:hypothetical protein